MTYTRHGAAMQRVLLRQDPNPMSWREGLTYLAMLGAAAAGCVVGLAGVAVELRWLPQGVQDTLFLFGIWGGFLLVLWLFVTAVLLLLACCSDLRDCAHVFSRG